MKKYNEYDSIVVPFPSKDKVEETIEKQLLQEDK